MKKYLGVKLIEAEPMTYFEFSKEKYGEVRAEAKDSDGYKVVYAPDGYTSFSPKDVFERAYMPLGDPDGNKIVESDISNFVKNQEASAWGEKTTVLHVTLKNGFVLSESSSCVDPAYFDLVLGANICGEKIKSKVWELLGFLLQCGKDGMK